MQRETELFIDSVVRENRPAIEMLTADYTFLNERLARHYGMTGVQGSHFRRVALPADSPRRGLLGHGSILTVTSPAIRTSPVIRGKWVLNNILGAPPPDPPPNVPALSEQRTQTRAPTMRERMAQHRNNPACSACHTMIDPAGFALENFDATGKWRIVDESFNPIDATGALPDGRKFDGVAELRAALAARPERFVNTLTEKLLTYALGRGLEYYDMPAVRKILKDAAPDGYRMHAIVAGVVKSYPFRVPRLRRGECRPMIITKLSLDRRTFLRGVGATVALPFLDAMVPALATAATPPMRLGFVYVPNGMYLPNFHPAGEGGTTFELTPVLQPIEPVRAARGRGQRAQQHAGARQRSGRRRAHAQSRRLAQRHAAEAHRGRQHHQREDRRSVRGRQAGRRHAAALAGADSRVELPGRQLRGRLQLRLPELHVVADAEHAAAARRRPARRLPAPVRRRRHRRQRGCGRCRPIAASSIR